MARLKLQMSADDPFSSLSYATIIMRHCKSSLPSFDMSKVKDNDVLKDTIDDITKDMAMHRQRSSITRQGLQMIGAR